MIHALVGQERSIRSVVAEGKKLLYIPFSRVIIPVGTLIPIRNTQMIPEILKNENNKEK